MAVKRRRPGDLNREAQGRQLERVFIYYEGICQICFLACAREDASREHIIPLRHGGSSDDSNVVLAHRHCNEMRNWVEKAIRRAVRRQSLGLPSYSEPRNPGPFAPFSRIEDKPNDLPA